MSGAANLLRFAAEGERVRRATSALEQASPLLASALRRAMPFLSARGATVNLLFSRVSSIGELVADLPRPIHATRLVLGRGGAGAIVMDAGAISTVLDGVLGGDGRSPPRLEGSGLTSAQVALVARIVEDIVRAFSDVLDRKFGITLRAIAPDADDAATEDAPVACSFELGGGSEVGRVALLLPKEALVAAADARPNRPQKADPRVLAVVEQVELEIVAELARVKMTLGQLSRLKVGDVIRLETPVGGKVVVRADGRVLLRGHPTTSGGQIAVRVVGRHDG
jgi:flagellar motor switch protein FliM